MKKLLFYLTLVLIIVSCSVSALSAGAKVTFTGRDTGFVFEPGSTLSSTDLFPNFKNVMPGDSYTQKITVKNYGDGEFKSKIYMRALGAHEDSEEFLSNLKLTVQVSGDNSYLFDSTANATAGLTDWTLLGTLYAGNSIDLDVTLDVPTSLDTKFENTAGYLDWEFMVEEHLIVDPAPPTPITPPTPEKQDIPVKIVWMDDNNADGKRPDAVTVELITQGSVVSDAEIGADSSWEHVFENVLSDKAYSVEQEKVDGYTTTYSGNAKDGFVITNVYTKPVEPPVSETKDVVVQIVWMDNGDEDGKRPEKVTVTLILDDGSEKSVDVTADNGWTHVFKDIDKDSDCRVVQGAVEEYKTEYSGNCDDGFVITNVYTKPIDPTPDDPTPDDPTPPTGDTSLTPVWRIVAITSFIIVVLLSLILIITRKKHDEAK